MNDKTKDTLGWSWTNGDATNVTDFGDPTASGPYALCLYDESSAIPALAFRAVTRNGLCGQHACWKRSGGKAFRYKDPSQTPDGLDGVLLKSGSAGKARILVSAKGSALTLPALPLPLPARMQLHAPNGQCWEAQYFALGTKRNDAKQFKGEAFLPPPPP